MALTKAELVQNLTDKLGINKRESQTIVEMFFQEIIQSLVDTGEVKLSGFGNFTTRDKKSRPGRNPKTGEPVEISARRVVTFHAGQKLKARVEAYHTEAGKD